jgi:hypothetical protein
MDQTAKALLLSFIAGLSLVATGCASEESKEFAADGEFATLHVAVVHGASKVAMCNLPRYTRQTIVRLCGYATPGQDASPVTSVWFTVDDGAPIPVVPEWSGGFVDTFISLAEGTHSVRLYAQSAKGHLTFEEKTVTVDVTPPVLTVLYPTSADVLPLSLTDVTSSVVDLLPVRVQTQWVGTSVVESGVGTVTHTINLVNRGYNTLLVRATDAVGNTSEVRVSVYVCPSSDPTCSTCTPTTCAAQDATCGTIPDGCGGVLECGPCSAPDLGICSEVWDGVGHAVFTPGANCQNFVDGVVADGKVATNRENCYSQISFGACNCAIYGTKGYFPVAGHIYFLSQRFKGGDQISSEYCLSRGMNVPAGQVLYPFAGSPRLE